MTEPRTEAGRALLAGAWALGPGQRLMVDHILAIEAEAASPSLDRDRLAAALRTLIAVIDNEQPNAVMIPSPGGRRRIRAAVDKAALALSSEETT